jgi:flagellar motor switch protein FliM
MADETLSQEEVEALLRGVRGEPGPMPAAAAQESVHSYDLGQRQRIVRRGMPALGLINERFASLMRASLSRLTRGSAAVAAGPPRVLEYSEFVRDLTAPASLSLVQAKPLRGVGLVVLDADLVSQTIDQLFGGQGRFATHAQVRASGGELTATELRIARRLLDAVLEAYGKAWEPVFPLRFEHLRSETDARFANIAAPTELVVTSSFSVDAGPADAGPLDVSRGGARFHLCLPYAILEPIRGIIDKPLQAQRSEANDRWSALLSAQVPDIEVELAAHLASAAITVRQLMRLETGDVVAIELPEMIAAEVDGVPVLECKYGVVHGRYALQVVRIARGDAIQDPGPDTA